MKDRKYVGVSPLMGPVLEHGPRRPHAQRGEGAGPDPREIDKLRGWDPKDSELHLSVLKSVETLMEGTSRSDVQFDGDRWV